MRKFTADEIFDADIEDENTIDISGTVLATMIATLACNLCPLSKQCNDYSTKAHGNPTTIEECLSVWLSYDRFIYGGSDE